GEVGQRAGQPIHFIDDDRLHSAGLDEIQKAGEGRPLHCRACETAIVEGLWEGSPAFVVLALDEGLAGLALSIDRIEPLLEAFLGGFTGVDGAAAITHRPKKRRPDQRAPVMVRATAESDR